MSSSPLPTAIEYAPDPTPWILHDYVRIMHLSPDGSRVLMREEEGRWDFPYFVCRKSGFCKLHECCQDYQESLGIESEEPCFTLLVELLGDACFVDNARGYDTPMRTGKVLLLWVEQHIQSFDLPSNVKWQDLEFVQGIEPDDEYDRGFAFVLERVVKALRSGNCVLEQVDEPRYQIGWHDKACEWLTRIVEQDGGEVIGSVLQYRVTYTSTILRVNSSKGWYFLKAPLAGNVEVEKTLCIANVMPADTLDIVGSSEELRAFVSRGFKMFYAKEDESGGKELTNAVAVLTALGSIQLKSIACRDSLIAGGCPLRDPETIMREMHALRQDRVVMKRMPAAVPLLDDLLPLLEKRLARLQEYNIPLVLTNGDFGRRNFGFKEGQDGKEGLILFDWQFSCVSHPFFEFYDFFRMLGPDKLEPHIDEYLRMWGNFEPLERAREAFELAKPVGWLLRAITNAESIHAGEVEVNSPLYQFTWQGLVTTSNANTRSARNASNASNASSASNASNAS